MKKVFYSICIALFVMSCSSPVEEYIKNDFARVVREDALTEEVQSEINRVVSLLENLADEANPDAKQSKELEAKAKKLEREIETRMNNYNRTGSYSYIVNIYNDFNTIFSCTFNGFFYNINAKQSVRLSRH